MSQEDGFIAYSDAQLPLYVGVDVGGTNIKIGIVDDLGRPLGKTKLPTNNELGPENAIGRIERTLQGLLERIGASYADVGAVGLGTPGTQDIPKGMILAPPNLPGWKNFPIRDRLSEACGKPVAFANDANAAAFAEYWVGSGSEHPSLIMLTLGTGVGGGIIINGRSVDGLNSFGSECGHIIIDASPDARLCAWGGGRGELEAYASASAVVLRTQERLEAGATSSLNDRTSDISPLTALMIAEEADKGDELSLEIVRETGRYLGVGIVTLVHTIDPGLVLLGGAMNFGGRDSHLGQLFLQSIRDEFLSRAFDVVAKPTQIAFASLGPDAGYIGAAGVARANLQQGS